MNKKFKFFIFILFYLSILEFGWGEVNSNSNVGLNSQPSIIFKNKVNLLSGAFVDCQVDLVIPGAVPLQFSRTYDSGLSQPGSMSYSWNCNHYSKLRKGEYFCSLAENGTSFVNYYNCSVTDEKTIFSIVCNVGMMNNSQGVLSGMSNILNRRIEYYETSKKDKKRNRTVSATSLKLIDGAKNSTSYEWLKNKDSQSAYYQNRVTFSNGNRIRYNYDVYHDDKNSYYENPFFSKGIPKYTTIASYSKNNILLSSARYEYRKHKNKNKPCSYSIHSPDDRKVRYDFQYLSIPDKKANKRVRFLTQVTPSDGPPTTYSYYEKTAYSIPKIYKKSLPHNRFVEVNYNDFPTITNEKNELVIDPKSGWIGGRVSTILEPIGSGYNAIPSLSLSYSENKTGLLTTVSEPFCFFDATDVRSKKTYYQFNKSSRLRSISTDIVNRENENKITCIERFTWDGMNLKRRSFEADNKVIFLREYAYDKNHNVIRDRLAGILTGKNRHAIGRNDSLNTTRPYEIYSKKFTYATDGSNRMTMQDDGRKVIVYTYDPKTNLLKSELCYDAGQIKIRKFYHYDAMCCMTREITDDGCDESESCLSGVTERQIRILDPRNVMPTGVPHWEEHRYLDLETGEEVLVKREGYHYTQCGKIKQRDVYDSNGVHVYSDFFEYNSMGQMTKERNALGEVRSRSYDELGNLQDERGPDSSFYLHYFYDYSNRPLLVQTIHADGRIDTVKHQYDYAGNRISTTTANGNTTEYEYDSEGRLLWSIGPEVMNERNQIVRPKVEYRYNAMGHVCKTQNPTGNWLEVKYTVRGTPYYKKHFDGTTEHFEYTLDGLLKKHTTQIGTVIHYSYDYAGRVTREELYSPSGEFLSKRTREYNAFHLLSETDAEGKVTRYSYYPSGKLRSEERNGLLIRYEYDTMGRKIRTFIECGDGHVRIEGVEYDLLNRPIKEWSTDENGNLLKETGCQYDCKGNQVEVYTVLDSGRSVTRTDYDYMGRVTCITNPEGTQTHTVYDDYATNEFGASVTVSVTTTPLGMNVTRTYDTFGQLVQTVYNDPYNKLLRKEMSVYDVNGNLIRFIQSDAKKETTTEWKYDSMNRIIREIEAVGKKEQQTIRTYYNAMGQKCAVVKPDGVTLYHNYDSKGRLRDYCASDFSFHYLYLYDALDRPVEVHDQVRKTVTYRNYDEKGRLKKEILGNGLAVSYSYDLLGRPTKVVLPDKSAVGYVYDAGHLQNAIRYDAEGRESYRQNYLRYDLSDHVTDSSGVTGQATTSYDRLGRVVKYTTEEWSEEIVYNIIGNVVERSTSYDDPTYYKYDYLDRLTREGKSKYTYDGIHNRTSKDGKKYSLNSLNQVLHDGEKAYKYDLNGNIISIKDSNDRMKFEYDGLDRLVKVVTSSEVISYRYDEQNRRLGKYDSDGRIIELYVYQGKEEVGACNQEGVMSEFRLLALGKGADIGATVAVELNGKAYGAINDQQGSVVGLIDLETRSVVQYNAYTAFGEERSEKGVRLSPWGFSSKRVDLETGLVYFGRRYYAPWIGKWITPDPIGHEGGPNLYAYVKNNPLIFFDLYGLNAQESQSWSDWLCGKVCGAAAYVSDAAVSAASTTADYAVEAGSMAVNAAVAVWKGVGACIQVAGDDIIPVPLVRDAFTYTGMVMQDGSEGHQNFKWCWDATPSQVYQTDTVFENSKICVVDGCGIKNNEHDAQARAREIETTLGIKTFTCYHATYGLSTDLLGVIGIKSGANLPSVKTQVAGLRMGIAYVGGVGNGGVVCAHDHSGGGTVLQAALNELTPEERMMIHVNTAGSATIISPEGLGSAMNYVCKGDCVPFISDFFGLGKEYFSKEKYVTYLPVKSTFPIDHAFDEIYKDAAFERINDIKIKMNGRK